MVRIFLCDSHNVCVDPIDPDLGNKNADGQGVVHFNPRVGGCDECTIIIRADGVPIREFHRIVSTDWDGAAADGRVDDADQAYMQWACNQVGIPCVDYNGNGSCDASDLQKFGSAYNRDQNPNGCIRVPETVEGVPVAVDRPSLGPVMPNPVVGLMRYTVSLPEPAHARVSIVGAGGQRVANLLDSELPRGTVTLSWDPRTPQGLRLGNGIYFLRLEAGRWRVPRMFVLAGR